jgi:hypothetical protein
MSEETGFNIDDMAKRADDRLDQIAEQVIDLAKYTEAGRAIVTVGRVEEWLQKLILTAGRPLSNTMRSKYSTGTALSVLCLPRSRLHISLTSSKTPSTTISRP